MDRGKKASARSDFFAPRCRGTNLHVDDFGFDGPPLYGLVDHRGHFDRMLAERKPAYRDKDVTSGLRPNNSWLCADLDQVSGNVKVRRKAQEYLLVREPYGSRCPPNAAAIREGRPMREVRSLSQSPRAAPAAPQ